MEIVWKLFLFYVCFLTIIASGISWYQGCSGFFAPLTLVSFHWDKTCFIRNQNISEVKVNPFFICHSLQYFTPLFSRSEIRYSPLTSINTFSFSFTSLRNNRFISAILNCLNSSWATATMTQLAFLTSFNSVIFIPYSCSASCQVLPLSQDIIFIKNI